MQIHFIVLNIRNLFLELERNIEIIILFFLYFLYQWISLSNFYSKENSILLLPHFISICT